jgi:hypothetical protein
MKHPKPTRHIGQYRVYAERFGVDNWTAYVRDEDVQDTLPAGRLMWHQRALCSSAEAVRAGEAWVAKQAKIAAWRLRARTRLRAV